MTPNNQMQNLTLRGANLDITAGPRVVPTRSAFGGLPRHGWSWAGLLHGGLLRAGTTRGPLPRQPSCSVAGSRCAPLRAAGTIFAAITTLTLCSASSSAAQKNAASPPRPAEEAEAAYTRAIEKRVADILAALELKDPAKSARVHDLLIAQYRALRDWHDANDANLQQAAEAQAREIKTSLKILHAKFVSGLEAELTPGQVEKVKDKMTYGKVKVTYDAYCEIVPNLTEPQKRKILELLQEAREEAMDGGSAGEKSAIFKKYKGKINNYLTREGHDVKQAYKDWGAKQKAGSAQSAPGTEKKD